MHFMSADLDLQYLVFGAPNGGVKRAVAVLFGRGNIVIRLVGDIAPKAVNNTQYRVTLAHARNQNAHGANIVYLGKWNAFALHFAPDTVDMFGAAIYRTLDARLFQLTAQQLQ